MKFEPDIDRTALIGTIRQVYGYPVTSLTFFPEGTVGCHYIIDCQDERRFFVTLLTGSALGTLQTSRLDFILALRDRLHAGGLFTAQPRVCRTLDGKLKADLQGQALIVCEFIEGENLWGDWPPGPALGAELGGLAACLHNTTPLLGLEIPYVERFNLPFERELHRSLDELQEGSILTRPGQQTLSELILPQRGTLLALLARLHELRRVAQKLNPPMVLVHTDMHGGNLIRSKEGELFVVDWEGAMLAPAEHDLFLFVSDGFGAMLAEYLKTATNPHLFPELLAYYIYRRNLEDIAYFLLSILHENTSDEQDQVELGYLRQDCLEGWSCIESSIRAAQEQLREVTP